MHTSFSGGQVFICENVPLVEFKYHVFTRLPGESDHRQLRSLFFCLCDVFRALINSLVCLLCLWLLFVSNVLSLLLIPEQINNNFFFFFFSIIFRKQQRTLWPAAWQQSPTTGRSGAACPKPSPTGASRRGKFCVWPPPPWPYPPSGLPLLLSQHLGELSRKSCAWCPLA